MTYTLQEIEGIVTEFQAMQSESIKSLEHARDQPLERHGEGELLDPDDAFAAFVVAHIKLTRAAVVAIPELIAVIRELDPSFHAKPPADSVARAQELMREAGEKRAKLASAVAAAKLGSLEELNALGLEAYFEDDGTVKIRQKKCEATVP